MEYFMKLLRLLFLLVIIITTNQEVRGDPLQLLTVNEDKSTFSLNKKALDVFTRDGIKDRTVVVISIVGDFRTGKSFMLNFFLRYLEFTYKISRESTSLLLGEEDAPLRGFEWKTGQERVTSGIQMWSEIFCATLPDGEKVAIVLLDTQGLFDHETTYAVNTKIFTLATLVSSVLINNLMQRIPEDKLQHLKFFTDYGSMAVKIHGDTAAKPFQKLLFLVQNWPYPHQYPYGSKGGQQYLERVLKTSEDQHSDLSSVRTQIKSSFEDVNCFLMPYPGSKVVTSETFDGRLSDIEEEYKTSLSELVPSLLALKNLVPKKIDGQRVKAIDFANYLNLYVNVLNSNELPEVRSIMDVNAEMSYQKAFDVAKNHYIDNMKEVCGYSKPYVSLKRLLDTHSRFYDSAFAVFNNFRKFSDNRRRESFSTKLKETLSEAVQSCIQDNEEKQENVRLQNRETKSSIFGNLVKSAVAGFGATFYGGPVAGLIAGLGTLYGLTEGQNESENNAE